MSVKFVTPLELNIAGTRDRELFVRPAHWPCRGCPRAGQPTQREGPGQDSVGDKLGRGALAGLSSGHRSMRCGWFEHERVRNPFGPPLCGCVRYGTTSPERRSNPWTIQTDTVPSVGGDPPSVIGAPPFYTGEDALQRRGAGENFALPSPEGNACVGQGLRSQAR